MRMERFSYAQAESCLYEGMRWKGTDGKILAEREGRSRIDESMTQYNVFSVKDCLMPDGKFRTKKYAKEHRGETIADYHNSQVSSQSRAVMSGQRMSNAIGLVATLPRDNPWIKRTELTEEEFEYMRDRMIEKPHDATSHKKDEALEKNIREKLTRVKPTPEEREQINAFLLGVKDAWLEVCHIRPEDVLFFSIHWDETFPHIHCLALPTVAKTYEEDVYSKRVKKDGTRTLLHKAGETDISYSVSRFYEGAYYDNANKRHYPFMESYHQEVIKCLQDNPKLSDEIHQTASKLINGATKQKTPFLPKDFSREQRDEGVLLAEANRLLQTENAKKAKEIEDKDKEIQRLSSDVTAMQEEFNQKRAFLQEKLNAAHVEVISAKKEAAAAHAEAHTVKEEAESAVKVAEDMVAELQAQEIHLRREISSLRTKLWEILLNLKETAKKVVEESLTRFVPLFRMARNRTEEEDVTLRAEASISDAIMLPVVELEAEASALLEENSLREVNLSTFTITPQRYGFAIGQIKKAAFGTRYEEEFASITKENAENNSLMKLCLKDWFAREKYSSILSIMTEEEEVEYMKSPARATRAIEYLDACVEAGLVEFDNFERG